MFFRKVFTILVWFVGGGLLFFASALGVMAAQVTAGSTVRLSVTADGTAPFAYQWKKEGRNLAGATAATLTIINFQGADVGTYTVAVANSAGSTLSDSSTIVIALAPGATATSDPVFTLQPLSQAVFSGSAVVITAAASGTPAPSYQWRKDGVVIPGATSSTLNFTQVQLADAGNYALIATNARGVASSSAARLVVLVPQGNAITYSATVFPSAVTAGGMVSLDYLLTNAGTTAWGSNHYLSIRDSAGAFLAFVSLAGVAPGETKAVNLRFSAPVTPGAYTYHVQAIESGVALFSTEAVVALRVLAAKPNAISYDVTTFPVRSAPGATINFNYKVTNIGSKAWGVNHYLSLRNGEGLFVGFTPLTGIGAGQSQTVYFTFKAPTVPGIYSYHMQALEDGVEFFETEANLTLVVGAPQSNAIVYNRTRSQNNVIPGATVSLQYSLSNSGTAAWGANHYASLRDSDGMYLAFIPLSGTAPFSSRTVQFDFVAPTKPGTYTYYVQALESGVEFFETQDRVTLTVLATPLANALTFNVTTFPGTVTRGSTVNFSYNVTNRGTAAWGANHYLSLRDADEKFLGFSSLSGTGSGVSKNVDYSFVAPSIPGTYTYRVQGLESGVQFFDMEDTVVLVVQ